MNPPRAQHVDAGNALLDEQIAVPRAVAGPDEFARPAAPVPLFLIPVQGCLTLWRRQIFGQQQGGAYERL